MAESSDLAIFVLERRTTECFTPCACARGKTQPLMGDTLLRLGRSKLVRLDKRFRLGPHINHVGVPLWDKTVSGKQHSWACIQGPAAALHRSSRPGRPVTTETCH